MFSFWKKSHRNGTQQRNRPRFDVLEDRLAPAVLTVNSLADNTTANSGLTLREAILLVNNAGNAQAAVGHALGAEQAQITGVFGSGDRIQFDPALNSLSSQTILLNGKQLTVTKSVSIDGSALDALTIDANNRSRIFNINDGKATKTIEVSLIGKAGAVQPFTLTHGKVNDGGGAIFNAENLTVYRCNVANNQAISGGGIENAGFLNIAGGTTIQGNSAQEGYGGGGIYNQGTLVVDNGIFRLNQATYGGAIDVYEGSATISNSGFDSNSADGIDGGGAIVNLGYLSFYNTSFTNNSSEGLGGAINNRAIVQGGGGSLFQNNSALSGGALANDPYGDATITSTSFLGNSVQSGNGGGAIYNRGTLAIDLSTFQGNQADYGGAIDNYEGSAVVTNSNFLANQALGIDGGGAIFNGASLFMYNCLIAGNTSVGFGGGIANRGDLTVASSIITLNRADSDGDGSGDGGGIYSSGGLVVTIASSLVEGNFVGTGSIISNLAGGPFNVT